jgi:hypothetical protein
LTTSLFAVMFLVGEVEAKEINYDREANRAHARGSAEKEPGNYFWGGPSAHANVACWVCSVRWSHTSSYDSDHIAADYKGPESTLSALVHALFSHRFPRIPYTGSPLSENTFLLGSSVNRGNCSSLALGATPPAQPLQAITLICYKAIPKMWARSVGERR